MAATQSELSMDEILASIRRIIHEEEAPAPDAPLQQNNTVALEDQRGTKPSAVQPAPEATDEDAPKPVRAVDPESVRPMKLNDLPGESVNPDPKPALETVQEAPSATPADILAEAPVEARPAPRAAAAKAAVTRAKARTAPVAQPPAAKAPAPAAPEGEFTKVTLETAQELAEVTIEKVSEEPEVEAKLEPQSDAETDDQQTDDDIMSDAALDSAAAAFAALKENVRATQNSPTTIDGMVEALLRPMLRAWLDENLPAIVEKKVEAEIRRLRDIA